MVQESEIILKQNCLLLAGLLFGFDFAAEGSSGFIGRGFALRLLARDSLFSISHYFSRITLWPLMGLSPLKSFLAFFDLLTSGHALPSPLHSQPCFNSPHKDFDLRKISTNQTSTCFDDSFNPPQSALKRLDRRDYDRIRL